MLYPTRLTTTALASVFSVTTLADAQTLQAIDIPAQGLAAAIAEFGRETGVQVGISDDLAEGKKSNAIKGAMNPMVALSELLEGTGLTVQSVGGNGSVVTQDAVSQDGLEDSLDLGTLILTGERVERDVFNTASSVQAFDGQFIEENPQNNDLESLFENVPNITTGTGNQAPVIRGVNSGGEISGGALGALAGALPRATVTIDGRNLSPNETIYGTSSVFDTEIVEVFRGPQTTSQGANAIAGAINVRTRDPIFEQEAALRVEGASDNGRAYSLMFNTPLSDDIAVRFVRDHESQDTFFNYAPAGLVEDVATQVRQDATRVKLLYQPLSLPEFSTKLTFNFIEFAGAQNQALSVPLSANIVNVTPFGVPSFVGETLGVVHDVSYDFGNGWSVRNQYQYSEARSIRTNLPGAVDDFRQTGIDQSNELIIDYSPDDGSVSGFFGIYYRETEDDSSNALLTLEGDRTGFSLFGEITKEFQSGFDVTGGLRYQVNEQTRRAGFVGLPLIINFDETFEQLLPRVALGYQPSDNTRFALQVSQGYNPGGAAIVLTTGLPYTFEDEFVTNVELSLRHRSADGSFFIGANLFYNDYEDYQLFISQLLPAPTPVVGSAQAGQLFNVDDVQTYGLEVEAEYLATPDLTLRGALGLLGTDVGNLGAAITAFTGNTNNNGNELPLAPNVTLTVGADYQVTDRFRLGGSISYVGEYFSDITNDPGTKVGNYVLVDVNAAYEVSDTVELYGYVNNIFDSQDEISLFRVATPVGAPLGPISFGSVTPPREIGFGLRATF